MKRSIIKEVTDESKRAIKKHGDQSRLHSIHPLIENRDVQRIAEEYEIPTEQRAKFITDCEFEKGELTWAHIAVEELSEVVCAKSDRHRRVELIQLMSVCERWIDAIDKRLP